MSRHGPAAAELRIGGFQPFSTVDYPDALSAVVFCQGCPLRCRYCHNPGLLAADLPGKAHWLDITAHLSARRGLLDAVVFSGGEPLIQKALIPAMIEAKALGFRIGLHTSGVAPARLRAALDIVDWVGFDVKAPFAKYERVTGAAGAGAKAQRALEILAASGVEFEIRTTLWPGLVGAADIQKLAPLAAASGAKRYALQEPRDPATRRRITPGGFAGDRRFIALQKQYPLMTLRRS